MSKLAMKTIRVHDAVGSILCHDITRIVPGESKGPVFRKGHVVRQEDVEVLLQVGKEHLYVFESLPGMVHENDAAARIIAAVAGVNLAHTNPKEGRIDLLAACDAAICNDSGLMHITAAVGTPLVAVYGSTSTAYTPPLSTRVETVQTDISCRPCFKRECPLGHLNCLKQLDPDRIWQALQQLLA